VINVLTIRLQVAYPKDISKTTDPEFRTLCYESYNFTVSIFWPPFLVKANKSGESVAPLPRRAGRRLAGRGRGLRLRRPLGGELVHPALRVPRRRRPRRRLPLLPRPRGAGPHAPHGAPRARHGVRRDGGRADAVADVALRGRGVGQGRRLPADAAVRGRRGAHGGAGPRLPRGAGGGVRQGEGGGGSRGREGEAAAHGHHGGDAAPAGRAPEPVRPLGARERDAVQRLRALVPARPHRRLERDALPDVVAGLIHAWNASCRALIMIQLNSNFQDVVRHGNSF
jgi:hypothetical protein